MIKFILSLLNFLLLLGSFPAVARNPQDTSDVGISRDSATEFVQDSVSAAESPHDSVYLPVQDTLASYPGNIRRVSEQQTDRYKNHSEYAYANDPEYWEKVPPQKPGLLFRILNNPATLWIFLSVIAILIIYGVYQLALENNFTLLVRTVRKKTEGPVPGLTEDKINFEDMIRINQSEGNYRMAIRFLYLRLIHMLREKSGISFGDSSTNAEIVRAIGGHPGAAAFRWLASAYEHVFYGEFVPDQETYFLLKNKFDAALKIFSD